MRTVLLLFSILSFILFYSTNSFGQVPDDSYCGLSIKVPAPPDQLGGRYITSFTPNNTFLRVLVVFVQFPDDNYNPNFSQWPVNQSPTFMGSQFIDQDAGQNSTNGNITDYFWQMSQQQYKVIGTSYYRQTSHTRSYYIQNGLTRPDINKEVLQNLDATVNYNYYDYWTYAGEYNNYHWHDSKVDMIFMIYRNISNDLSNPGYYAYLLGFGQHNPNGTYSKWSGEASLGYGSNFQVENGTETIQMGFGSGTGGPGSGITIMEGYRL